MRTSELQTALQALDHLPMPDKTADSHQRQRYGGGQSGTAEQGRTGRGKWVGGRVKSGNACLCVGIHPTQGGGLVGHGQMIQCL